MVGVEHSPRKLGRSVDVRVLAVHHFERDALESPLSVRLREGFHPLGQIDLKTLQGFIARGSDEDVRRSLAVRKDVGRLWGGKILVDEVHHPVLFIEILHGENVCHSQRD